jgi:putative tricarboxylic transport membrane protein
VGPLEGLVYGFGVALTPANLIACFVGVLIGTIVGVLPGIGPVGAMALLLPSTYALSPTTALIMLAGIYYGAMYGGSTTSILVNVPGEAASVVTTLDGYQMARKGRAGAALAVSAVGSFVAGSLGVVGLMLFAAWLADAALQFGPPEYFALSVTGLAVLSRLSGGSVLVAFAMVGLGLAIGTVGMEPISGYRRFTFGSTQLSQGLELVPIIMGLYGVAEVLVLAEEGLRRSEIVKVRMRELFPTREEWRRSSWPIARGSVLGFLTGLVPGPSTVLATFISYTVERRLSKTPERFGTGAIEGVAGPEAANNGATAGAMVPLLSLGIPFSPATAILLGALVIHGLQPGPLLISQNPEVFWGFIASMYIGNAMLLVLNLPLIGIWVRLLKTPYTILFPLILLFCLIGVYSLNSNVAEIIIMLIFGIAGFFLRRLGFEGAPFILAMVLGPIMETSLRQTLLISRGSFSVFYTRPICATLLVLTAAFLIWPLFRRRKNQIGE